MLGWHRRRIPCSVAQAKFNISESENSHYEGSVFTQSPMSGVQSTNLNKAYPNSDRVYDVDMSLISTHYIS